MDNYNVNYVENKWKDFFLKKQIFKSKKNKKKNFIVLKCFLIRQGIFIWATFEIIP